MRHTILPTLLLALMMSSCNEAAEITQEQDQDSSSNFIGEFLEDLGKALEPDDYTEKIVLYEFQPNSLDSIENCTIFKENGRQVDRSGSCYYHVPFDNEFVPEYILSEGLKNNTYETFDSLMCEVGGNSAYDKYVFNKDSEGRVNKVRHYMAWYEVYDEEGELITQDKPDYFLGHELFISYGENSRTIETFDNENKLIARNIDVYRENGMLKMQSWQQWDSTIYKAYYYQKD